MGGAAASPCSPEPMSLAPGLRSPQSHPTREMVLLAALAVASALLANALAGPTRRLAWRAAPLPTRAIPPAPAPAPAELPVSANPQAPTPVPPPGPAQPPRPPALPPKGAHAAPAPPPALQAQWPVPPNGAPVEISDAEAQALHRAGALFLDARRTGVFEAGHIAGARALSVWEDGLEVKLQVLADEVFDPKDPVVIYCSGGDCQDSHLLADRLWPLGFRNLRIFKGGWPAWQALGGPSATGPEARR